MIDSKVTSLEAFHAQHAEEVAQTLKARDFKDPQSICRKENGMKSAVRRLTPKECERLQGFPDNWTLVGEPEEVEVKDYKYTYDEDGNVTDKEQIGSHTEIEYFYIDGDGKKKKCSDTQRYKALGNSLCLPFWQFLARRICAQYERDITMGSLFDGIGGFPLVFQRCGAFPIWASEIEDFPIQVTKKHFGDDF